MDWRPHLPAWADAPPVPAGPSGRLPRLGSLAGSAPAGPQPRCPGTPPSRLPWVGIPAGCSPTGRPFQAGAFRFVSPAGPAIPFGPPSPQRLAGSDPAWPGFFTRPPSLSPGWARLEYSGWAALSALFRPGQAGIPWPRPDYSFPGQIIPLLAEIYSLRIIFIIWHRLQRLVPVLGCL
jgi:hypothetical protein